MSTYPDVFPKAPHLWLKQIPAEASPALHLITDTSDERFTFCILTTFWLLSAPGHIGVGQSENKFSPSVSPCVLPPATTQPLFSLRFVHKCCPGLSLEEWNTFQSVMEVVNMFRYILSQCLQSIEKYCRWRSALRRLSWRERIPMTRKKDTTTTSLLKPNHTRVKKRRVELKPSQTIWTIKKVEAMTTLTNYWFCKTQRIALSV